MRFGKCLNTMERKEKMHMYIVCIMYDIAEEKKERVNHTIACTFLFIFIYPDDKMLFEGRTGAFYATWKKPTL
jgi:hypothetical protein